MTKQHCEDARNIYVITSYSIHYTKLYEKDDLDEKLERLIEFSSQLAWGNWAKNFRDMKNILYSDSPTLPDFHKDLIVAKNYSLLARQVLYSAVSSWCFTGMGSWSDNGDFPEIIV